MGARTPLPKRYAFRCDACTTASSQLRAFSGTARTGVGSLEAMDAIVAEGLRKRYDEVQALDGVSFAVREGDVFGLLGPNGAGKSTTVRVLVTLTHADQGPCGGRGPRRRERSERRATHDRLRPAGLGGRPARHRRENLMLQGRVQGMGGRELRARVQELLLDEPTTRLDPEARVAMLTEVSRLAEAEALTILLTTHYPRGGRPARRPARVRDVDVLRLPAVAVGAARRTSTMRAAHARAARPSSSERHSTAAARGRG
jgi:ABC-type lipoprotein export system ATPase subunit